MLFTTFLLNGSEKIGVLKEGSYNILDISSIEEFKEISTMLELIEKTDSKEAIDSLKQSLDKGKEGHLISLDAVQLLAPIPRPIRDVICLGLNYKDHVAESKSVTNQQKQTIENPIYFSKMASYIIGPDAAINSHSDITDELDYEVELAIIVGKEGTNIPREKAEEYIFGYSILNDLTARNLQRKHNQWLKGKSLDTLTAMGPYILHKSAIPFPVALNLSSSVNGEVRQNSNTDKLIFDIPYIISDLSQGLTLRKGDIIATGTPAGVGMGFNPPKYLKKGDTISCSIEGIGTIKNHVE